MNEVDCWCLFFFFQTLFDNQINASKKEDSESINKNDTSKKMSVERVYQKKTQLEHILLRPDTYIGSVEPLTQVSVTKFTVLIVFAVLMRK